MTPAPAALPRLLAGLAELDMVSLGAHRDVHGPLPELAGFASSDLISLVERAGLVGRGGAAFPAGRKLRAVAAARGPRIVVANAAEGEPASQKDCVLIRDLPHLVLDGIAVAARAVGTDRAVIAVSQRDEWAAHSLELALRQRARGARRSDPQVEVVAVRDRFVAGQESALVNALSGREGKPAFDARPYEHGVHRSPTLVQNAETLAHLALIARHGAGWFRALGTDAEPGSTLVTVSGAVAAPGVYEVERGAPLAGLLTDAGAYDAPRAVLLGGYGGCWIGPESIGALRLSDQALPHHDAGARLGTGVVVVLPQTACPVAETCRVADYLAAESCGQCGPCVHGLAAIAAALQRLASGTAAGGDWRDLERWLHQVRGRGACRHPDGAASLIESGLRVFAAEFGEHARLGPCASCARAGLLPLPAVAGLPGGW